MKHLKRFENSYESGIYWLIPTDIDRFRIALSKVGCDDTDWYNLDFTAFGKYIYLSKRDNGWEWNDDRYFYENLGYKYMGVLEIEDWELDQNKYNL